MKLRRKDIFLLLDNDCVNPQTTDEVKKYIDRLLLTIRITKSKKGGK